MRTMTRLMPLILLLLVGVGLQPAVAAQSTGEDLENPCAGYAPATPTTASSPASDDLPAISPDDAVVTALAIHQRHVVTALEVIIASSDDADLLAFAQNEIAAAQEQLESLDALASQQALDHPAELVAVLDRLRMEQDQPADQGSLDAYLPGSVLDQLCREGVDRDAVASQVLLATDTAIIEIAALGSPLTDGDTSELVATVSASASARLAWFDARAAETAPAASPAATPGT